MAKALRTSPCEWALVLLAVVATGCGSPAEGAPATQSKSRIVTEVDWENDVTLESLKQSVHAKLDCADCHTPREGASPEETYKGVVQCRGCHEKSEAVYDESVHGKSRLAGKDGAARCQDCHGAHNVFPAKDSRSLVNKRRLPNTCARCHDNPIFADKMGPEADPRAARHYAESIHGAKLLEKGTVVAPSCVDCHGGHDIAAIKDPKSKVSAANIVGTCGDCHEGIVQKFSKSVHGKALAKGDADAPVCTSCHTAHNIDSANVSFKLASDQRCGKCHQERFQQHLGTYHGRAHVLGGAEVAACFNCHGSHEILSQKDPASMVSPEHKLETCRTCHADAPPKFASFMAHGDSNDRKNYAALYWTARPFQGLLWGAVALFALHTLAWSLRSGIAFLASPRMYLAERRRRRQLRAAAHPQRFRFVDRFCHVLLLVSFVILVCTGMPLKFHAMTWAQWFFGLLGGADVARALHKLGAGMTLAYVVIHLASLIGPVWRERASFAGASGRFSFRKLLAYVFRPDSPMLGPSDFRAMWKHLRWFLGRGPEPTFGRFGYWEKLDYFAVAIGIAVIGATGLLTWMPEVFTTVLPGWFVNVAQGVHSGEALIAAAFLVIVHLFHVLPGKRSEVTRHAKKSAASTRLPEMLSH